MVVVVLVVVVVVVAVGVLGDGDVGCDDDTAACFFDDFRACDPPFIPSLALQSRCEKHKRACFCLQHPTPASPLPLSANY